MNIILTVFKLHDYYGYVFRLGVLETLILVLRLYVQSLDLDIIALSLYAVKNC